MRKDYNKMRVTKEWLIKQKACDEGVAWFAAQKESDGLAVVKTLITQEKLDWANWLIIRLMDDYRMYVLYAVYAAEQVIAIYESEYPGDKRPREAIIAAKKCIKNPTKENKNAAYATAYAAYATAYATAYAAYAADAAYAAAYAAYATYATAYAANAAYATAYAADAAYAAAYAAYATYATAYAADAEIKLKILAYGIKLLEEAK